MNLFLVRGLPGAGKTTFAQHLSAQVVEADHYFYDEDGVYRFNAKALGLAHAWCMETTRRYMNSGTNVAVSNTFTRDKELKPYFGMAEEYGYTVHVVTIENRHAGVSTHNVPTKVLDNMRNRFKVRL